LAPLVVWAVWAVRAVRAVWAVWAVWGAGLRCGVGLEVHRPNSTQRHALTRATVITRVFAIEALKPRGQAQINQRNGLDPRTTGHSLCIEPSPRPLTEPDGDQLALAKPQRGNQVAGASVVDPLVNRLAIPLGLCGAVV
jgi:hypothetical protein